MFLRLVEETTGWVLVTLESLWYNMVYYNIHEYTMVSSGILIVFVRLKKMKYPKICLTVWFFCKLAEHWAFCQGVQDHWPWVAISYSNLPFCLVVFRVYLLVFLWKNVVPSCFVWDDYIAQNCELVSLKIGYTVLLYRYCTVYLKIACEWERDDNDKKTWNLQHSIVGETPLDYFGAI